MNYLRLLLAPVAALVTFFAWGFLTEGCLIWKDFASSAAPYRASDMQMKYMPFGMASTLVALLAAVLLYAGWCGGTSGAVRGLQFGLLMGVFRRMHPPYFQSCHYEHGCETRPGNRSKQCDRVGTGRPSDRSSLQAPSDLTYPPHPVKCLAV
jgi:hypothetical protein